MNHRPVRPVSAAPLELLESRRLFVAGELGVHATYFDNADFTAPRVVRDDARIDFNWQARSPLPSQMGADTFSARWLAQVRPAVAGSYRFVVDADPNATTKLRIRGSVVNLQPTGVAGQRAGTISLPANQTIDLTLEYVHLAGNANVSLKWQRPGDAVETVVPREALLNTFSPAAATFTNAAPAGADPWVVKWQDEYIYVWSDGGRILGARTPRLQDVGTATQNATVLFTPPPGTNYSQNVWAPELHRLDNKWFLYFAADNGINANHRMYVAERGVESPLGSFAFAGKIAPVTDRWAIDGTVLQLGVNRYFVWSGWQGFSDGQQDLYIAQMSSPTTLSSDRVRISQPTLDWERNGLPINEGPTALQQNGTTHLIFSGSGYWTKQYALGRLTLTTGANPLLASSWAKQSTPVFSSGNGITGTGHASFTTSPDDTENWIVFHAHKFENTFNEDRVIRMQPFTFDGNNIPNFGTPAGEANISEPSGTPTLLNLLVPLLQPKGWRPTLQASTTSRLIDEMTPSDERGLAQADASDTRRGYAAKS